MCRGGKNKLIHKKSFLFSEFYLTCVKNSQVMEANFVMSRDVCLHIGLSAAAVCVDNLLTSSPDSIKRG